MKSGTDIEHTEVLSFTSKTVPFGADYDYGQIEPVSAPGGRKSRKRKILLQNMAHETKARNQNVTELVSTMKTLADSQESENPSHPSIKKH